MESVVLPKAISPVTRADRIKRAKPREDAGGGSPFARYRRAFKQTADNAVGAPAEGPGDDVDPQDPEAPAERGDHPARKSIDIRV